MKEEMKKLTVLCFYKERDETTKLLQDMGIVHPETGILSLSSDTDELESKKTRVQKTINYLNNFIEDYTPEEGKAKTEIDQNKEVSTIVDDVSRLRKEKDGFRKKREVLAKQLRKAKPWGEFDKEKINRLADKGLYIRFYVAKRRNFNKYDFSGINHFVISEEVNRIYFVTISQRPGAHSLPFEKIKTPQVLPSEVNRQIDLLDAEEVALNENLTSYSGYLSVLEKEILSLTDQIEFLKVSHAYNAVQKGKIMTITGWYPAKNENQLLASLQEKKITYSTSKAGAMDHVPVKLHNNKYSTLFEPVTRVFQLPNYHEFDLTPLIAVFYPIFFAYCLGDAGYGMILLIFSLIAGFTFLKGNKNIALFGVLLGAFTTVMGIVKSGSIFGIPTGTSDVPFFQFLSQFIIIPDDRSFIFNAFNVALLIGVVQILVGVASSIFKMMYYHSFKHSLPQIGKFLIICSTIIVFLGSMQGVESLTPYVPTAKIILFLGIGIVLFFHDLNISIFKRIGSGVLPLFFIFTGILGDVLSYVRLFALGVVSSVLGLVVNQIGMQIMDSGWTGIILGIVFLLFGHSLNLCLAILGAVVHPLRLTFVEFYNNAQFEGGGIEYKPFKNLINNN